MAKTAKSKNPPDERQPNPEAVRSLSEYAAALRATRDRKAPDGVGITKRTATLERLLLEGLAQGYSVATAAWAIGVHRSTAFRWKLDSENTRREDGTFADDFCLRWETAMESGIDLLEDEAHRRAARGVEKPVYQGGMLVGTVTEYSDNLLMMQLKGRRPARYNTERHELTGANGGPIATSMQLEFIDPPKKAKL